MREQDFRGSAGGGSPQTFLEVLGIDAKWNILSAEVSYLSQHPRFAHSSTSRFPTCLTKVGFGALQKVPMCREEPMLAFRTPQKARKRLGLQMREGTFLHVDPRRISSQGGLGTMLGHTRVSKPQTLTILQIWGFAGTRVPMETPMHYHPDCREFQEPPHFCEHSNLLRCKKFATLPWKHFRNSDLQIF